jgi:hypothetical protein
LDIIGIELNQVLLLSDTMDVDCMRRVKTLTLNVSSWPDWNAVSEQLRQAISRATELERFCIINQNDIALSPEPLLSIVESIRSNKLRIICMSRFAVSASGRSIVQNRRKDLFENLQYLEIA